VSWCDEHDCPDSLCDTHTHCANFEPAAPPRPAPPLEAIATIRHAIDTYTFADNRKAVKEALATIEAHLREVHGG
jgi:hypothetical protein